MLRTLIATAAATAALFTTHASAQAESEISLFGKGHFKGVRNAIAGPTQFGRPFVVRSLVIPPGIQWDLCSGNSYSGCRQVEGSISTMVMTVRSARPAIALLPADAGLGSRGSRGQSLRGLSSEFFVVPEEGGNRVEVRTGTTETMSQKAGEYCRSRGWRSSVHGRLQPIDGKVYLADVLCIDTGR